jgi:hypothetical protein
LVQLPDLSCVIAKLEQANVGEDLPQEKRYGKYQQVKRLQEEGHCPTPGYVSKNRREIF